MLTAKYKKRIEQIALDLHQSFWSLKDNDYDLAEILNFIESLHGKVLFDQNENKVTEKEISLSFSNEQFFKENEGNRLNLREIFFHEVWHFLENTMDLDVDGDGGFTDIFSSSVSEMSAGYFSRAMLMPEKDFIESVIENTDIKGMCNVFGVAKKFKVDYTNVIGRGNDLNLWNMKVGI